MTQMDLFQIQTQDEQSLQPVTHVNHFHLPGSEVAAKMTATSGRTFFPLFKPDDLNTAFSKMFMGMSLWASTKCFLTWNVKPTPQGRSLFQLVPSTPTIEETGSGSSQGMWLTPTATNITERSQESLAKREAMRNKSGRNTVPPGSLAEQVNHGYPVTDMRQPKLWPTPAARDYKGTNDYQKTKEKIKNGERAHMGQLPNAVMMWPTPTAQDSNKATKKWRDNHQNNLTAAVFNPQKMWPTPTASTGGASKDKNNPRGMHSGNPLATAVSMWPTPAASDYKGAPKNRFMGSETYRSNLCEAVRENQHSAHLNPDWVEWLMGYPSGWTNPQTSPEPPAQQKDAPQGSKD